VIVADTSVWVHHIRESSTDFLLHLNSDQVLMHSWVVGELALGNLPRRDAFLRFLNRLPPVVEARDEEVMEMIEGNRLQGSGIGWVDAHLVASARLSKAGLWTRDKRLFAVAQSLGVAAHGLH
jgi:predicted nucleic acid-binding protein